MRSFQRRRSIPRLLLSAFGLIAALVLASIGFFSGGVPRTEAQKPVVRGPFIGPPIKPKSFDGDLRNLPKGEPKGPPRIIPLRGRGQSTQPRSIQQPSRSGLQPQAVAAMPTPSQNFQGIGLTGLVWPPDTNGDVGPNYYIQAVNDSFQIFNKAGATLAGPIAFNSLWVNATTLTPCHDQNQTDPIVLYDQLADRWLLTDLAFAVVLSGTTFVPAPPFYECIAVSKTSDPVSGGWYFYDLLADPNLLNDYPKFGLWPDAYYMTANMYNSSNDVFVRVWALDRNAMLSGGTLNSVHFDLLPICLAADATCPYFSLLPSNLRGTAPPNGSPNYLANIETTFLSSTLPFSSSVIHLWKFHVDWGSPANSTLVGPTDLSVASFTQPLTTTGTTVDLDVVPQKDTTTLLDTIGDRLMMQAQYRNLPSAGTQSLWLAHTINSGSVTGIRWYEIHISGGSFSLNQQGTFDPGDGNYRWLPSLAVDGNGNMAVGYSISSSSINPGIRYAGRLRTDPLNQLSQGEATLIAGTGSQTGLLDPITGLLYPITRWGDYSAMTIDPNDNCTFWYTNEYYLMDGLGLFWQTRIGSFKMPSCSPSPTPTPTPYRLYLPIILKDY